MCSTIHQTQRPNGHALSTSAIRGQRQLATFLLIAPRFYKKTVAVSVGVDVTITKQKGITMALSNAEKVRRYRERQKVKKQEDMKRPTAHNDIFRTPFFEFFTKDDQIGSQFSQALELAGVQPPSFTDDTGPEASTLDDLRDDFEEDGLANPFGSARGSSLGKAEVLVGCLLDAASDLAGWINDYKKTEIKARLAELENSDLSDANARRAAFAKVAELGKMLEDLEKSMRWQLPQWKAEPRSQSS